MKKITSTLLLLTLAFVCMLSGCTTNPQENPDSTTDTTASNTTETPTTEPNVTPDSPKHPSAMTYAEYVAAELDAEVKVDTYIQAKQSWYEKDGQGVATFYTADQDGAYFIYNMPCTQEQYATLTVGTRILVTGYKSEWAGEVEITDATFEVLDGTYIAEAKDLTDKLGTDDMIQYQNQLASFKGLTIVSISYKNDGGDDIEVKVSLNDKEYTFYVEYYLTNDETEVYKAFANLQEGDLVDIEGFVYWYNGINTHITAVKKSLVKHPSAMTYAEYVAAELDAEVKVDTYIQAKQSWYEKDGQGVATFYTADQDGAYFIYNMPCTQEQYATLTVGTRILVTGYKSEWAGEVEITDATFEVLDGTYIAEAKDLTDKLGTDDMIQYQNQLASFKGLTIVSISYKNDGGDDIEVKVSLNDKEYTFYVEYYLTNDETEVYKAFANLQEGDLVDIEGFVYWYNGINTHITAVKKSLVKHPSAMTYAEYVAAELDAEVKVDTYIQAKQSWYEKDGQGVATFYTADQDGAYFIYNMPCTQEQYAALTVGTRILVTGYKSEWAGEVEITDATFEVLDGTYIAEAKDLTDKLGTDDMIQYQNQLASFKGLTIVSISYKNDGGDDIEVKVSLNNKEYTFYVEYYLTNDETEVYKAFADLQEGDLVDIEGFVYWYNGINTHITAVTKVTSGK